ncbi:hypothetical protein CXB51_004555 [Gossypium anomalum]|uniref:Uncharacterized protein n=1 Tax=Gossypium anomalum TaxID=47600 RepID=A0A8J5Z3D5_9ROSI|nr:hypothetical protein CXB51_004555 [Gossypium anomalum]
MCKAIEYFAISAPIKSFPIPSIVGARWDPPPQGPLSPNLNAISFNTHSGKATAVRTCWPNLEALLLFVPLNIFCLACIHFVNNLHTV